jgi:anti-anti-sigma factor
VAGEIDMSNARRFRDALGLAAAVDGGSFAVDLTGVEYLDSACVHALFAHASRIRLIAGPLLEPVLTVSGLSGITSAGEPQ